MNSKTFKENISGFIRKVIIFWQVVSMQEISMPEGQKIRVVRYSWSECITEI
jgi:hypothetical protein